MTGAAHLPEDLTSDSSICMMAARRSSHLGGQNVERIDDSVGATSKT